MENAVAVLLIKLHACIHRQRGSFYIKDDIFILQSFIKFAAKVQMCILQYNEMNQNQNLSN